MEDRTENEKIVTCHCGDKSDHVIHFAFDDDEQWSTVTANLALNHYLSPWKRLVLAVKYVLGMDNTYYHYVENVLPDEEVAALAKWLTEKAAILQERKGINSEIKEVNT